MAKYILFSDENKVIGIVKKILDDNDEPLVYYSLSKIKKYSPTSTNELILIDLSGVTLQERPHTEIIVSFNRAFDNKKMVMLKKDQIESVFYSYEGFDDYILIENLESELIYRLKFNTLKNPFKPSQNSIVIDNMVLDLDKYELTVNGLKVELTYKEFELLKILVLNQDKVFSREKLLSKVWGYDFYGGSRTVDVHIRRLRTKIEPPYNLMLKTIRNVGYLFSQSN